MTDPTSARRDARVGAKLLLGFVVSAVFVWLAIRGVDLRDLSGHFRRFDAAALAPILALLGLTFLYKAARWQYQMATLSRVALRPSLRATVVGFAANNILPLRGGDVLRAHMLAKSERLSTAAVLATVLLERLFDVLSMVVVTLAVLLLIPVPQWMREGAIMLGIASVVALIGLALTGRFGRTLRKWTVAAARLLPAAFRSRRGDMAQPEICDCSRNFDETFDIMWLVEIAICL